MILKGLCKKRFIKDNSFIIHFLPERLLNLVILRWFNTKTYISIDIQNWLFDGYDFCVQYKFSKKVYLSEEDAGSRSKDFDKVLKKAIVKANSIYNSQ